MDKVVQLAAMLQAEATQAALLSQNERNALVARVQVLQKENQRHLELEAQLMTRVKMLEHAVWQLRKRCGEEAGAEPSKEPAAAAATAVKKRQHSRRALLARLLQENGVEAGANLAGVHLSEYELKPPVVTVAAVPVVVPVTTAAAAAAPVPQQVSPPLSAAPPSSPSGLEDLQALARGIGVGTPSGNGEESLAAAEESGGKAARRTAEQQQQQQHLQQQQEQKRREQEEEEQLARSLGVDASKMMKRMGGGTPVRRKGAAAAQLVAAALGAAPNRAAASPLAPVSGGFGSPGPSVAAPVKWACSHTLRSHLDVVRGVAFHAARPLAATCSDDWTVRLFACGESKKKGASFDCLWTYRGHTGPVLAVHCGENAVFSGGIDGSIVAWAIPEELEKGREGRQGDMAAQRLWVRRDAHEDAVWGLRAGHGLLLSHGADQSVRLWREEAAGGDPEEAAAAAALHSLRSNGRIVGADLLGPSSVVVATAAATSALSCLDAETGQTTLVVGDAALGPCAALRAVPEHSAVVSGHSNSKTCLWDLRSGAAIASFVAHTEAVACLDANGSHIVTGSGDAIRLWDFGTRACISDFVAHRKKFDEGVTALRLAPPVPGLPPMFASGAGDGIAKIFSQQ